MPASLPTLEDHYLGFIAQIQYALLGHASDFSPSLTHLSLQEFSFEFSIPSLQRILCIKFLYRLYITKHLQSNIK